MCFSSQYSQILLPFSLSDFPLCKWIMQLLRPIYFKYANKLLQFLVKLKINMAFSPFQLWIYVWFYTFKMQIDLKIVLIFTYNKANWSELTGICLLMMTHRIMVMALSNLEDLKVHFWQNKSLISYFTYVSRNGNESVQWFFKWIFCSF